MVKVLALLPQFPIARRSDLNDNVPEPMPPVQLRVVTLCGSCKYLDESATAKMRAEGNEKDIQCSLRKPSFPPKRRCDLYIEAPAPVKKVKAKKNKKKKLKTKKRAK